MPRSRLTNAAAREIVVVAARAAGCDSPQRTAMSPSAVQTSRGDPPARAPVVRPLSRLAGRLVGLGALGERRACAHDGRPPQ